MVKSRRKETEGWCGVPIQLLFFKLPEHRAGDGADIHGMNATKLWDSDDAVALGNVATEPIALVAEEKRGVFVKHCLTHTHE